MSEPEIPTRGSSRAGTDASCKARLEDVKRKRKLHQISQESLDCLADVHWYDEEIKIIELEQTALGIKIEALLEKMRQAEKGLGDGSTVESRYKLQRDITRQEIALEQRKAKTEKYRDRVKCFMERIFPGVRKELHEERVKFAQFVASLVLQDFSGSGTRPRQLQQAFHRELIEKYECESKDKTKYWDLILHDWYDKEDGFTASHLFPYRLGEKCMEQVFGLESAGDLFSYRNGLLLPTYLERKVDKGLVVIVPKGELIERRWKIRVLDKSILNQKLRGISWIDLDDTELKFRNEARPSARYLYFLYAVAVLKKAQKSNQAWQDDHGKYIWATQGKYISKNILITLGEAIGHKDPTKIANLSEHVIADKRERNERTADEKIRERVIAEVTVGEGLLAENEEDQNDDDEEV